MIDDYTKKVCVQIRYLDYYVSQMCRSRNKEELFSSRDCVIECLDKISDYNCKRLGVKD